ncbi:MAG: TetR/AcrR family transcriptional regulator, partial [Chloroflexota bacterium]|nr:TetR/AcrR family transcriptional regulator [Micrococcaceae bacterium]
MARNADAGPGWRVRKRAAAQASIEDTAVSLALKHGYENVTVEMICAASSVSQRTFFNYFGSKEGVILGASRPAP